MLSPILYMIDQAYSILLLRLAIYHAR